MKFKKGVQGGIKTIITMAVLLIATTLDSTWSMSYLTFILINAGLITGGALLLKKYGRPE